MKAFVYEFPLSTSILFPIITGMGVCSHPVSGGSRDITGSEGKDRGKCFRKACTWSIALPSLSAYPRVPTFSPPGAPQCMRNGEGRRAVRLALVEMKLA